MRKKVGWPLTTKAVKSVKKKPNKILLFPKGREPWDRRDIIFLQEDWRIDSWTEDGEIAVEYKADARSTEPTWVTISNDDNGSIFEAAWRSVCDELIENDVPRDASGGWSWSQGRSPLPWRNAQTMPEWASRFQFAICGWETVSGSRYKGGGIDKDVMYTRVSLVQSEEIVLPKEFVHSNS